MPAKWKRINPGMAPPVGQIQAVAAKKHLTVFQRSPSAPGAGSPEQKLKFSKCAAQTKGVSSRLERNTIMRSCLR
ncbi:MAG: hypothetical protein Q8O55_01875 [Dehalococcoidales bacterium]|nr:hypothetical protein [Dehalococcoidales bacterium]